MFGSNGIKLGLTLPKILGGISKTLGVVNQVIPLYKEAKPMIANARNALSLVKEFSNTATNRVITHTKQNTLPIKEKINNTIANSSNTGPTFFL